MMRVWSRSLLIPSQMVGLVARRLLFVALPARPFHPPRVTLLQRLKTSTATFTGEGVGH